MSEVQYLSSSENPIKEGLLQVIQYMRKAGKMNKESTLQSLMQEDEEFGAMIQDLEAQKVDFSGFAELSGMNLLKAFETSCRENFNRVEQDLRQVTSIIPQEVKETLNYTPEVQTQRKAWSKLAQELKIDESKVEITNTGIMVDRVATFDLEDDEDATYNELKNGEKSGLKNLPDISIWQNFQKFISNWPRTQQETFLTEVMGMHTTKKGDWNFYLSATSPQGTDLVHGLFIHRDGVGTHGSLRDVLFSVRRVQN